MKPPTVFLGEMTNREVEAFVKTHRMVIVPTGAVEQHGPHGPLLTDVLIPNEVARRAAPQLGAAVAPPINYALSYPHKGFTGVVYLRMETFRMLVEDIAVGLATMGFKRIVFLNGHYDNTYALAYACASVAERLPADVRAFPVNYWDGMPPERLEDAAAEPRVEGEEVEAGLVRLAQHDRVAVKLVIGLEIDPAVVAFRDEIEPDPVDVVGDRLVDVQHADLGNPRAQQSFLRHFAFLQLCSHLSRLSLCLHGAEEAGSIARSLAADRQHASA